MEKEIIEEKILIVIFQKRIIRDLIGVFLLSVFVLGLKAFSNSQTQMVYNYSKNS